MKQKDLLLGENDLFTIHHTEPPENLLFPIKVPSYK